MADESSFIVEILLRARDEATATVAALRAEVAALKRESESSRGGTTAPLSRDLADTSRAAKDAEKELGRTRSAHEGLRGSARSGDLKQGRKDIEDVGSAARGAEKDFSKATSAVDDHRSAHSRLRTEIGATTATQERGSKATKNQAERAEEAAKSYEMFDAAVRKGKVTNDDARRGYQQFAQELSGISRQFRAGSDEALNFSRTAAEARARVGDFGPAEAEIRRVASAYKEFDRQAKTGALTTAEVRRGYKDFSSELGSIGRAFRAGSQDAQRFLAMADQAGKSAKKAAFISPGEWNWDTLIAKTAARFDDWGIKVVSLSANLRGLALAAIIGLAQQLDTAVVGLAGGLFSVASAAVQAGAALGGALVSGISQAIPVLAVLGATVERVKNVLQAVQLAGQTKQSQAASPFANQIQQLQNASSIASAEHSLSNAYEGVAVAQAHVRTAQEQLTLARTDAIRNITDLTLAEKEAKLQAEGANISLTESQRRLQEAIQAGNTAGIEAAQLGVKEAELQQKKAKIAVPRAEEEQQRAASKGVARNPQVISAQEGLRSAQVALRNQRFEIQQAQQQLRVAQLQSKEVRAGTTQQRQLGALTSKFTGPEKALYDSLVRIQNMLKSPSSPLAKMSDYLVAPFAKGISRIADLFGSRSAMAPLDNLAKAMGRGISEIEKVVLGSKGVHFFDEMAGDAAKNIPLVSHSFGQLLGFFQSIAKTAAPVLHDILVAWDKFITRLNARDSSPEGIKRLSTFFERAEHYGRDILSLAEAFGRLVKALGRSSAQSGDNLITGLTKSMDNATKWVNTHGPEVKKFFEGTADSVRQIGKLLLAVGGAMLKIFNPSSLAAFSGFISQIILPALTKVLNVLGWITTAIMNIAKAIPGGTAALQVVAGIVLTLFGIGKLYEPFKKTVVMMDALTAATKAFFAAEGLGRFKAAWEAFEGVLKKVKTTTEETAAAQEGLNTQESAGAGLATADAAAQAEVATAEGAGAAAGAADAGAQAAVGAAEGAGGAAGGAGLLGRLAGGLGIGSGALALGGGVAILGGAAAAGYGLDQLIGAHGTYSHGIPVNPELKHQPTGVRGTASIGENAGSVKANEELAKFGKELQKVKGSLSDLPAKKMEKIREEAERLAKDPSLNEFHGSLEKIANQTVTTLKHTKTWAQKSIEYMNSLGPAAKGVAETFQNINQTTGSILDQIREVVHTNSKKIAEDLGTNTKAGKDALVANFGQAVESINKSMAEGTVSTGKGMAEIGRLVATALKQYGINPSQINRYVAATTKLTNSQQEAANLHGAGFAEGGWIHAVSGGRVIRAGEAGHNEVVLSTDPSKAYAQGGLLNEYLRAAPKVAQYAAGGSVYEYPFHGKSTLERVDQGRDIALTPGSPITAIGDAKIMGIIQNWYKGQPFLWYELLNGPDKGRYPYDAEQITRLARPGSIVKKGQPVAYYAPSGTGLEAGWATRSGQTLAMATTGYKEGQATPAGSSFAKFLGGLHRGVITGGGPAGGAGPMGPGFEIEAPKVKGLHGQLQKVAQGALNKVTTAAAKYVEKVVGQLPAPSTSGPSAFPGVTGTGGSPSANERLGRSMMGKVFKPAEWPYLQKLWTQESGWNANSVNPSSGAYGIPQSLGHGHPFNLGDARAQIAWGLKYIKERYKTVGAAWAHEVGSNWYEAGGKIMGRAPWGGRAVPIIAHEEERVLNPAQFGEAARLGGTTAGGLDRHLGFIGGSPKQHFQGGGAVKFDTTGSAGAPVRHAATLQQLGQANLNQIINVDYALKVFQAIKSGFATINKRSQLVEKALIPFINAITDEQTGVIAKMQIGFTALTARLTTAAAKANFKKVAGSKREFSSATPLQMTDRSLKDLEIERKNLEDQAKILAITEREIRKRIQQLSHKKQTSAVRKQLQQLVAAFNKVVEAQNSLSEEMAQNVEQAAQQTQARIQNMVTEVNSAYGVSAGQLQLSQSAAQAQGRFFELPSIDAQIAQNASEHIGALVGALQQAQATGNTEMVASIQQEMQSLQQTIVQATAQQFADAEQAIQQQAGLVSSRAGLWNTISGVLNTAGNFRGSGEYARSAETSEVNNAQNQIREYRALLSQAQGEGNLGQIATLTEAINQLEGVVVTNEQALRDNTSAVTQSYTAQITRQGQFSTGIYGGLISLLQTMGQITGKTNVAGEAGLYQQSNKALEETNKNLISGEGGLSRLLGSLGIKGVPNLEGLSGEALVKALSGLNIPGIESQMDPAQQQAFEGIINALLQNSQTIEVNNKELATLNGQLLQPQAFSSAPWSKFRDAVFTGMGGLMPSVAAALNIPAASNPALTGAGFASGSAPLIEEQNIHITTPIEVAHPGHMGKQIAWAMKSDT